MSTVDVGDTGHATLTVTEAVVEQYADLVGDHNPLHVDEAYASEAAFGGRIGHAMLTAGVVSAAVTDLPGDTIYLSQDSSFVAPVRLGDTVEASATVTARQGPYRVTLETVATVDDDSVLEGEAVVIAADASDERLRSILSR